MKKKIKKIPKYSNGIPGATAPSPQEQFKSMYARVGGPTQTSGNGNIAGDIAGAIGAASGAVANAFGIEQGKVAQIGNAVGDIASTINPFVGAGIKLVASTAGSTGGVDWNTGEITNPSGWIGGIWGNKGKLRRQANIAKNSIMAREQTENLKTDYYNNVNVPGSINMLAAEGGVMRQPVDALVSKGELIYNPVTKKLSQVPGSKGKPNKADDVYAKLYEGDVVISNSPTMLMANGKTPAQNLMGMVDKYATGGTVKAREAIIKKVVNWQEANKTKPQEYGTLRAAEGWDGIIESWDDYLKKKYTLSKDNAAQELNDFWGYDSKAGKYTNDWDKIINHIGKNEKLKAKAIKDLSGLSYIGNGANAWDNIVKAAHDKNVRDVHRYFRQVGDDLVHNQSLIDYTPSHGVVINRIQEPFINKRRTKTNLPGATLINSYENSGANKKLTKLTPEQLNTSALHYSNLKWPKEKRSNKFGDVLDNLTDLAPLAAAMFRDYDYHTEQPYINPVKYVPTGVNIDPIRRAADESYAMARYNQTNINPNTGAGMAYGLQAASNRAKALSDAYQWQQEQQNKLIGQNVGIYNTWAPMEAQARHTANTETRQNEAAAQQMKDSAIRDAYEFITGRRNDRWKLSMLEPMFKYAVDDKIWKKFKV